MCFLEHLVPSKKPLLCLYGPLVAVESNSVTNIDSLGLRAPSLPLPPSMCFLEHLVPSQKSLLCLYGPLVAVESNAVTNINSLGLRAPSLPSSWSQDFMPHPCCPCCHLPLFICVETLSVETLCRTEFYHVSYIKLKFTIDIFEGE